MELTTTEHHPEIQMRGRLGPHMSLPPVPAVDHESEVGHGRAWPPAPHCQQPPLVAGLPDLRLGALVAVVVFHCGSVRWPHDPPQARPGDQAGPAGRHRRRPRPRRLRPPAAAPAPPGAPAARRHGGGPDHQRQADTGFCARAGRRVWHGAGALEGDRRGDAPDLPGALGAGDRRHRAGQGEAGPVDREGEVSAAAGRLAEAAAEGAAAAMERCRGAGRGHHGRPGIPAGGAIAGRAMAAGGPTPAAPVRYSCGMDLLQIELMDAVLARPVDRPGWIYELKYDGYRILAGKEGAAVRLRTKPGTDATTWYPG